MNRLADSIILLWGWRRILLAFLAGASLVLTLPPFNALPVGWIAIPILVWMIDGAATPEGTGFLRRLMPAFWVGWWFGFGYFVAGLWWIGASFLVEADVFAWLMPFAVVVFPAALALLWAVGIALARLLWTDGWPRLLFLAVIMTLVEWLRGHILTGFPWNTVGYALMPDPLLMQPASIVGLWGMTLLALVVFAAPVLLVGGNESGRGRWLAFVLILLVFLGDIGFGLLRLRGADEATVADVRLRIVQAAIPEETKQDPGAARANFDQQLALSRSSPPPGSGDGPTLIIWPETAVPYILTEQPGALAAIADMLPSGVTLVTGAPRRAAVAPLTGPDVYNSVLVISDTGEIRDSYDKVHLVPFGEYLPLADILEPWGIRQLITLPGGFATGLQRRTLTAGNAPPFSPLICYEAIFPGAVTEEGVRPAWLLNVTNDAWYGNTPGPHQHLQQAIVRAVEEGVPLVRAANTGISVIVDAYGRVQARLDLGEVGVIDGALPQALPETLYARYGDLIPAILLGIVLVIAVVGRFGSGRQYN